VLLTLTGEPQQDTSDTYNYECGWLQTFVFSKFGLLQRFESVVMQTVKLH